MSARSISRARGFSLVEVLVALGAVVAILVMGAELMFASQRMARRQELQVNARQTARAALEYVTYTLRSATDLNPAGTHNAAVITWLKRAGGGNNGCPGDGCIQVSYNNVTDPRLAEPGTDVITVSRPENPLEVRYDTWPGFQHAANSRWIFDWGCGATNDDEANLRLFEEMTGKHTNAAGREVSRPLLLVDDTGAWRLFQITSYQKSDCAATPPTIHAIHNHGTSDFKLNPPGGYPELENPRLVLGAQFVSLRVCNGWLEQKNGIFDPDVDINCSTTGGAAYVAKPSWTPLVPNVEDLQISYISCDGRVRNADEASRLPGPGAVPSQSFPVPSCAALPFDASNLTGFQVTIGARSGMEAPAEQEARFSRPAAADRPAAAATDRFYHYQLSGTAMIRNRIAGM